MEFASSGYHFISVDTPDGTKSTSNAPPLMLEWANLSLRAPVKRNGATTSAEEEKVILDNVTGSAQPGELLVIMGPSGAGKSSLLDCISGRKPNIEGNITVNGTPWTKSLKRLASYVVQDDLFYDTITVHEHLMFQAKLRMGKTHTIQQYSDRVDAVMEELGLMKSRDTLIGGPELRGISGGERKRLSFAAEILTNPSLLFVDEPTSGLDSFMAETVIRQLQQIARDGRTVIATIHQPSSELFALFDKLYLLSDGATVYHGKASESVNYFKSIGYQCPPYINPSDYFMRQLVVVDKASDPVGAERLERLKSEWKQHHGADLRREAALHLTDVANNIATYETKRLGVIRQMLVLAQRNVLRFTRDPIAFQAALGQAIFVAFVVGLIYLQLDLNQKGIQNFAGAFFFIVVNEVFSAAEPTFVSIPLELPIVMREYKSGLYRLFAWYLSKNVSELPFQVLMPVVLFVPTYLLIGIGGGFDVFVKMQIILVLVHSCAVGLGYMVSCLTRRVDIAPIIGVVTIMPFLLFGGLLINSDDAPGYFVWIQYISPIKYAFEALMKIYWSQVAHIPCNELVENCSAHAGADVLHNFSVSDHSALVDGLLLVAINVGFRTIGFLGLLFGARSA